MRYYVTADVHGFYSEMSEALKKKGYYEDTGPKKLIICGDIFDRGDEAFKLQQFVLEMLERDEIILIRGNHDDLALDLINYWDRQSYLDRAHRSNGTVDTVMQLTDLRLAELMTDPDGVRREFMRTPYIKKLMPAMIDYYETEHYIFTHGWIPCARIAMNGSSTEYVRIPDWRGARKELWNEARWINGMEAAHCGITEPGKTIVCGHWHASFGHSRYENNGGEFDNSPDFDPYYADGIIALDACTSFSGQVNCIVIED